MSYFLLSLVALLLGPPIYAWGRSRPTTKQVLDGFILVTIAGIVCAFIIPDAVGAGGRLAILFLLLGLAFPTIIERAFHRAHRAAHVFIVCLAATGLVVHALIDGFALLPSIGSALEHAHHGRFTPVSSTIFGNELAIGVILHRLPVGMAIWWSVRPSFGAPAAVATFVAVMVATAAAYFFGAPLVELADARSVGYFQAFVAGSLVHVVAFGVSHEHEDVAEPGRAMSSWGFRAGILLGLFVLFAIPHLVST
ncbi:MAG: hypothetical protein R3288_03570 [Woeseiaceae bacterium]|nr:hypothetical protein [Woeseiaceae bacterium]